MSITLFQNTRHGAFLNKAPLHRGPGSYHDDLINSISAQFKVGHVDREALKQILSSDQRVIADSHALIAKRAFSLTAKLFRSGEEEAALDSDLRRRGIPSATILGLGKQRQDFRVFGESIGVQYFDRSVTKEEMQQMLQESLGLVSLDWEVITRDPSFKEKIILPTATEVFPGVNRKAFELFYPVVPILGFTANTFIVQTYLIPQLEIENELFERARKSERAERTTVFITHALVSERPKMPKYTWQLPGAFDGTLMFRPEELQKGPEIKTEDVIRANQLAVAVGTGCELHYRFAFPNFFRIACLYLAERDNTGESLRQFEDHVLALWEASRENGKNAFYLSDTVARGMNACERDPSRIAENLLREAKRLHLPESESADPISAVMDPRDDATNMLVIFKELAREAFEVDYQRLNDPTSLELVTAAIDCGKRLRSFHAASFLVQEQSPGQQALQRLADLRNFTSAIEGRRQEIIRLSERQAFPPHILLTAKMRRPNEGDGWKPEDIDNVAGTDEQALHDHLILTFSKKGLGVGPYTFDRGRGALNLNYTSDLNEMLVSALKRSLNQQEGADDLYTNRLAEFLTDIYLPPEYLEAAKSTINGPAVTAYLSNKDNWVTDQLIPTKGWLEGTPEDALHQKWLEYLGNLHKAITTGITSQRVKYDPRTESIFRGGVIPTARGEEYFGKIVRESLKGHIPIAQVVLPSPAGSDFERICRREGVEGFEQYFIVGANGTLQLTQDGVDYVSKTVDPTYPYLISKSDSREAAQRSAEQRRSLF